MATGVLDAVTTDTMAEMLARLGAAISQGARLIFSPFISLVDPGEPLSLYMLLCAALFALGVAVIARARRGGKGLRFRAFIRFLFARKIWLHRSSLLDYKLYAINTILLVSVLTMFMLGSDFWVRESSKALTALFGPAPLGVSTSWWVVIITTLAQVLALDLGYWIAHYSFHKSEILWEFHKVHHSAEVMTPATELRQHPVELVAFPIVFGFTTGVTYACMAHLFGPEAQALGLTGQNIILVVHLMTFHHLRHSHVNMPFTGFWGKLFHSPAHHTLHHSADPKHFDRNLGYLFSIWDWLAGTLVMPKKGERVTLGIGHEGEAHNSVSGVMWQPFVKAWKVAFDGRKKSSPTGNSEA